MQAHDSANLPDSISIPLISNMANFTTVLTTFPVGATGIRPSWGAVTASGNTEHGSAPSLSRDAAKQAPQVQTYSLLTLLLHQPQASLRLSLGQKAEDHHHHSKSYQLCSRSAPSRNSRSTPKPILPCPHDPTVPPVSSTVYQTMLLYGPFSLALHWHQMPLHALQRSTLVPVTG